MAVGSEQARSAVLLLLAKLVLERALALVGEHHVVGVLCVGAVFVLDPIRLHRNVNVVDLLGPVGLGLHSLFVDLIDGCHQGLRIRQRVLDHGEPLFIATVRVQASVNGIAKERTQWAQQPASCNSGEFQFKLVTLLPGDNCQLKRCGFVPILFRSSVPTIGGAGSDFPVVPSIMAWCSNRNSWL